MGAVSRYFGGVYIRYCRRYIDTGSPAPIFHTIGAIVITGILFHAKGNNDRLNDPKWEGNRH